MPGGERKGKREEDLVEGWKGVRKEGPEVKGRRVGRNRSQEEGRKGGRLDGGKERKENRDGGRKGNRKECLG